VEADVIRASILILAIAAAIFTLERAGSHAAMTIHYIRTQQIISPTGWETH
jgi:hypothetical protein